MPDEHDDPQHDEQPDDALDTASEELDGDNTADQADEGSEHELNPDGVPTSDDALDNEEAEPSDFAPDLSGLPIAVRNSMVLGQLVLHYPERDVTVLLDGGAALRMLKMFQQRREGGLADLLEPEVSSASAGWVVLDLAEPLAMSWLPGLQSKRPRTAIDPAVAAA